MYQLGALRSGVSEEAKDLKCTGMGDSYRLRLRRHMRFPECKVEITKGSMTAHRRFMHGTELAINWNRLPVNQTEHHLQVDNMRFPRMTKRCPFSFPGCSGSSHTWNGLISHFIKQHWGGIIRILEEHPNPLPKCELCGIQVPLGRLNTRNYVLENCKQG